MGRWTTVVNWLRLGAAVAESQDATIKGIPIKAIHDEVEKDAPVVIASVKNIKDAKKRPAGTTGE